jgi:hypothetical protein
MGRSVCSLLQPQEIVENGARRGWRREVGARASWFRAKVDAVNFLGGVSQAATTLALQARGRGLQEISLMPAQRLFGGELQLQPRRGGCPQKGGRECCRIDVPLWLP